MYKWDIFINLYKEYTRVRHATILWGESVFFKRKSVSIRIIHQCIDVSRHFASHSDRDAVSGLEFVQFEGKASWP